MTKDEALRLALEALKQIDEEMPFPVAKLAQKVIKEALAQPEQGGKCKYCTDGCPACDARKLPEQPPYHHFVSDRFNIDPQTGNLNIGAVKKQEPVAWISPKELLVMRGNAYAGAKDWRVNLGLEPEEGDVGLYTTPPQRTWVELTDEEKSSFWTADQMTQKEWDKLFIAIEAKLKAKNT